MSFFSDPVHDVFHGSIEIEGYRGERRICGTHVHKDHTGTLTGEFDHFIMGELAQADQAVNGAEDLPDVGIRLEHPDDLQLLPGTVFLDPASDGQIIWIGEFLLQAVPVQDPDASGIFVFPGFLDIPQFIDGIQDSLAGGVRKREPGVVVQKPGYSGLAHTSQSRHFFESSHGVPAFPNDYISNAMERHHR